MKKLITIMGVLFVTAFLFACSGSTTQDEDQKDIENEIMELDSAREVLEVEAEDLSEEVDDLNDSLDALLDELE
jgi:cell division protein FtsB